MIRTLPRNLPKKRGRIITVRMRDTRQINRYHTQPRDTYGTCFMNMPVEKIALIARGAAQKKEWNVVHAGAVEILKQDQQSAEGHFLMGLVEKAAEHPARAVAAFGNHATQLLVGNLVGGIPVFDV